MITTGLKPASHKNNGMAWLMVCVTGLLIAWSIRLELHIEELEKQLASQVAAEKRQQAKLNEEGEILDRLEIDEKKTLVPVNEFITRLKTVPDYEKAIALLLRGKSEEEVRRMKEEARRLSDKIDETIARIRADMQRTQSKMN